MTSQFAIVTGTSSGLGAAVARALVDRGWNVVGIARRPSSYSHERYTHVRFDLARIALASGTLHSTLTPLLERASGRVGLVNNAATLGHLGFIKGLAADELERVLAANTVAPLWLMNEVVRNAPAATALRIVNVSTGAATGAYPGIGAYSISKAALRMAGMSLASEWDAPESKSSRPKDAAILSYEPGLVDTDMQKVSREQSLENFPWDMFRGFAREKLLVPPERPATEIVEFLESNKQPHFAERRLK